MLEKILDFIFPKKCFYCKKYGDYICQECLNKINLKFVFEKINDDFYDYIFCGSLYKGRIKTIIHNFKFHEKAYLYKYFIMLCLRNNKICDFLKNFDYITYVPMYYKKENIRGYNQAKLLAEELGNKLNIKVINTLEKTRENKMQSTLSEKERAKNVENVFEIVPNMDIANKKIILVDDIFTTGATVRACSKILKQNGVQKICIFTISKA